MLKLIRALSEFNGPTYDGAVMARAVIKASSLKAETYGTRPIKLAPPRMGIIEAYGGDDTLTVTLLRPLVRAEGEMPEEVPQGEKLVSFVIDKNAINAYLDAVDDTNSIHRGEHPVVPGLCMVKRLWQELKKPLPVNWDVKFKMPAFADEVIDVYKNGSQMEAFCGGRRLFDIKEK